MFTNNYCSFIIFLFALLSSYTVPSYADRLEDHVYGGTPTTETVLVRRGYAIAYDENRRIPKWVAYKVIPDYRNLPTREGTFASFRKDHDVNNAIVTGQYNGLKASRGYARGHLAPYGVMGGDRNNNGDYAEDGDAHDIKTIREANYMSNVAPQHHAGFNGSGGLWYKLERYIQDDLVESEENTVWVHAGAIFGQGEVEQVGTNNNISVPPMFYKIIILDDFTVDEPRILAFLFPHQRVSHGEIEDFLVSIDVIEAMTGLDFLSELDDADEARIEDTDTWVYWEEYFAGFWEYIWG